MTKLMVGVMVMLVVLVLVVVSSQLSKCAYRGWYLTKLMVGVMVVLVVVSSQLSKCAYRRAIFDKADGGGLTRARGLRSRASRGLCG